jgi:hypothetical protein
MSPASSTSAVGGGASSRFTSVKATSTPLAAAFTPIAASQKTSMSAASTAAAPAFMAAIATRPEPLAKSITRFPATTSGWSST